MGHFPTAKLLVLKSREVIAIAYLVILLKALNQRATAVTS